MTLVVKMNAIPAQVALKWILFAVFLLNSNSCATAQQSATSSSSKYRTDVDLHQLRGYLFNEKFLGILKNCLFQNGPCDVIGRWVKRMASLIFTEIKE